MLRIDRHEADENVPHTGSQRVAAVHERGRVREQMASRRAYRLAIQRLKLCTAALILVEIIQRDVEREDRAVPMRLELLLPGARIVFDNEGLCGA